MNQRTLKPKTVNAARLILMARDLQRDLQYIDSTTDYTDEWLAAQDDGMVIELCITVKALRDIREHLKQSGSQ